MCATNSELRTHDPNIDKLDALIESAQALEKSLDKLIEDYKELHRAATDLLSAYDQGRLGSVRLMNLRPALSRRAL